MLSDAELLAIVLRADQGRESVSPNLQTLLTSYSVRQLFSVDFGELCEQFGFGEAKAAQLQATLEVARRLLLPTDKEKYTIQSPQDAAALVRAEMLSTPELRYFAEWKVSLIVMKKWPSIVVIYTCCPSFPLTPP